MRVILAVLMLSSFLNLYGQSIGDDKSSKSLDSFEMHIGDYESFSVLKNGEELNLMHGEMFYDDFGRIETKTANNFPIMITTHKLEKIDSGQFFKSLQRNFREKFSNIGCIEETENIHGLDEDLIVLNTNEKLPFKHLVYKGYKFDGMLVDLLIMDIKNEAELKAHLSLIENIKFSE